VSLFARAQALLDERAAVLETRAPNTSDYLLTGLLRCRECGGAYFGAGTKGRNGFLPVLTPAGTVRPKGSTAVEASGCRRRIWKPLSLTT